MLGTISTTVRRGPCTTPTATGPTRAPSVYGDAAEQGLLLRLGRAGGEAFARKLAAEDGYDAAYATALKKATAEAAVAKAEPSSDMLGGFMGKGKEMLSKAGEMTSEITWPEQVTLSPKR